MHHQVVFCVICYCVIPGAIYCCCYQAFKAMFTQTTHAPGHVANRQPVVVPNQNATRSASPGMEGNPAPGTTQMGPVVSQKRRDRVLGYLEKGVADGGELVLEGGAAKVAGRDGYFVKPALIAGSLRNVAAREEIFGPVAFLSPFDNEEEGLRLANDTDYGLGNSVWSSDLTRCARVAEAFKSGNGWINAHNVIVHGVPYGGIGKSGMGGGVVSPETLNDYLRPISVVRPL